MQVEDGRGRGFIASVSESNRLNVSAKSNPRSFYISRDDGLAFTVVSIIAAAAAGNIVSYLKNTSSTRNLFIKEIHFGAVEAALWKTWVVTGVAAGGSELIATNLNLTSGKSAEVEARGSGAVTGLTTGGLIDAHRTAFGTQTKDEWSDVLILGPNDAIAIEYDAGTTGIAEVNIEFHFEDIVRSN